MNNRKWYLRDTSEGLNIYTDIKNAVMQAADESISKETLKQVILS